MSFRNLSHLLLAAFVAITICTLLKPADAAGFLGTKCLDQTGCCKRCPACDHVCNLDAELVDEEKPCFEVESKVICIPRVVFPWQTGKSCFPFCNKKGCNSCDSCDGRGCDSCNACINNGARTRRVCVLKTDKYTCPKCEYTWTAEKKPCATGCIESCCDSGCAAAPCDAAPSYREPQSEGLHPVHIGGSHEVIPAPAQ